MITMKKILLASVFSFVSLYACAESVPLKLPDAEGEIVIKDAAEATNVIGQIEDDPEIETHTDKFLERGYKLPNWINSGSLVDKVYEELAAPDYEQRNGKPNPLGFGIEIAQAYITKRGFYDLIVASRMPGDCSPDGCLFQIYSLIGQQWFKQLEFHAYDIAFKDGKVEDVTLVAAIAEASGKSKIFTWDAEKFVEYGSNK